MLKLRLTRTGRRHDPSFRVVVTESTNPTRGKYLESVGFYNAHLKQRKLNAERIKYWLEHGAQPSDLVYNLLVREGIVSGKKRPVHSTKPGKKKAQKTPASDAGLKVVDPKFAEGQETSTAKILAAPEEHAAAKEASEEIKNEKIESEAVNKQAVETPAAAGEPIKTDAPESIDKESKKE